MRVLILSPNQIEKYNWSHQLFRNEFSNHHNVVYYGDGFPNYIPEKPIPELVHELDNVDLIMTYGLRYTLPFSGLGEINNIPKVHIAVDYFPNATGGTYEANHRLFDRDKYDLYFGVVGDIVRNLEKNKVCKKAYLLPFSIDTNIYKKLDIPKRYDIFASFTVRDDTYPNRSKVQNLVRCLSDKYRVYMKRVVHEDYIQKINESKLGITSNNKFRSLSIKYYETMACGTLLLADEPEDFNELGFTDRIHCVLYKDLNDLHELIKYYIENDNEREQIALKGYEFVRTYHNNVVRVKQMIKIIQDVLGVK